MSANKVSGEFVSEGVDDDEEEASATVQFNISEPEPEAAATKQVITETDNIVRFDNNVDDDYDDDNGEAIPWHHMQLYQLYGDEADYFLHPKIVRTDKRISTKPSKLLRSLCGDCTPDSTGRILISPLIITSIFHFFYRSKQDRNFGG